nr:integrase, catalytic region, zinc finger, CCHC-type, peptidase aspartic, catalytic [Tanacetum cinerariifolium]
MVLEKKVNIKLINYAELSRLSEDFGKRFVPQQELSDEQAFWLQTSHPNTDQSASLPVKIEAPRELPKYFVDKQGFEIQKKHILIENDRLLDQIISQVIVNIVVNSLLDINTSVNVNSSAAMNDSVNYVEMCNKCLELEAEIFKQHNMVEKDEYNRLSKFFSKLKQHCISIELAMQLNKEIFQKNNTFMNQTEPSFDQLLELNNLKAELQAKDIANEELKANIKRLNKTFTTNSVKKDVDEIKTINIELEHRVAKLIAENEHLKQNYKQLYDSIKPSRVTAKEHAESLVNQLNQKSVEITYINAQLQEKVVQIVLWYLDSGCLKHMKGDRSQLTNYVHKFLGTVKFGNDQIAKIMSYYESVGISQKTSVAQSLQQNGFVERRNHTLVEVARTILIYAKSPLFIWAEAVAT